MSDLGARATIISIIWGSNALALTVGLIQRSLRSEVLFFAILMLTVGATAVSLVVWLTKWPRADQVRGFDVVPAVARHTADSL